jgi:hypothetical protein
MSLFKEITDQLESKLNGKLFPIQENEWNLLNDSIIAYVASIFMGDETSGQLAFDFKQYDFSYIPIELISLVYEQFLHLQGLAVMEGAFYTPEPIADYLISDRKSTMDRN